MASRRSRLVALGLLFAALPAAAVAPRWLGSQTAEITFRSCEVVNGEGRIHYDVVLPAASSLAFAWSDSGSDLSQVEVPPRWIPGWSRRESRILTIGPLNRTKMKVSDGILAGLFEQSISLELGKPYRMERGDRLQFGRWVLTAFRLEHR